MAGIRAEYRFCLLGGEAVGKTSLANRLSTCVAFNRKLGHHASIGEEATKFSFEISTSEGLILIHLVDWAWGLKRREESINQQLMRGSDGALFVYDVSERRSRTDFDDYFDWFNRACGFEKPFLIVSNKNDLKKRAVQDGEGQALASKGDHRAYCAVSLVDDTGIDELALNLARLAMNNHTLTLASSVDFLRPASAAAMAWSDEKLASRIASIGISQAKTKKVLLVALNSSVIEKFSEVMASTQFEIEAVGSKDYCEEEITANQQMVGVGVGGGGGGGDGGLLPIFAIIVPPTASESQQTALTELARAKGVHFLVSIPRGLLSSLEALA